MWEWYSVSPQILDALILHYSKRVHYLTHQIVVCYCSNKRAIYQCPNDCGLGGHLCYTVHDPTGQATPPQSECPQLPRANVPQPQGVPRVPQPQSIDKVNCSCHRVPHPSHRA